MTGTQLGSPQLVPQTTVSPSPVPQTTVSPPPPVPQTTVSPPPPVPQTTVSPPVFTATICHGPEQLLPAQLVPQTTFRDAEAVSHLLDDTFPLLQSDAEQSTP